MERETKCIQAGYAPGNGDPRTGYSFRNRTKSTVYEFFSWGEWSPWSDSEIRSNNNLEVETDSMTRYRTREKEYKYILYGSWSAYSDTAPSGANMDIRTRTVYRYRKKGG